MRILGIAVMAWAAACLTLASPLRADTLTLNDGTVLNGAVMVWSDVYWIKTPDGQTQTFEKSLVKTFQKTTPAVNPQNNVPVTLSAEFTALKRKADAVLVPREAIEMWNEYARGHAGAADLSAATGEIDRWRKLQAEGYERINNKWVGGEEKKSLAARCDTLLKGAEDDFAHNRSVQAVEKLKEANKIYPNSMSVNFSLGHIAIKAKGYAEAIRYFEQCLRLDSHNLASMNNLAVALWEMKKYEEALTAFHQAASIGDNASLAQNLAACGKFLPKALNGNAKYKAVAADAVLLAAKYKVPAANELKGFLIMSLLSGRQGGNANLPAGTMVSGTGFFLTADGLVLTNRHVVEGAKSLTVTMDDGMKHPARLVIADTEQDLALLRIRVDAATPAVSFSLADAPAVGAQCFVMGYPLLNKIGTSVKITQGIVSGSNPGGLASDIIIDAKVNPGNSGGPLIDKFGHIIGIVTMKSRSTSVEDSYGLAINAGGVRRFLSAQRVEFINADAGIEPLTAEEIAAKIKPSTVCVIATH